MSNKPEDTFASIDPAQLETVNGGTSSSNDQLTAMISSISDSIKGLIANQQNNSGGGDTMQMMMMMMMMGGMGGGGGGAVQYASPAQPQMPVINVDTSVCQKGKKGC